MTLCQLILSSTLIGLCTVFWMWFLCYEQEQRKKEAERARRCKPLEDS